jgi:hypothetical protein
MAKSEKIFLPNVRLGFPKLFRPEPFEEGGVPKFQAMYVLDPEDKKHRKVIELIEETIDALIKEQWKKKPAKLKAWALIDGDELAEDEKYADFSGKMLVNASNTRRPVVCDRDKSPIAEEDGIIYAGCYVNATITLWTYDNKFGKGISANLRGVQFAKDGEPFGEHIDVDDEFEDIEDDDDVL